MAFRHWRIAIWAASQFRADPPSLRFNRHVRSVRGDEPQPKLMRSARRFRFFQPVHVCRFKELGGAFAVGTDERGSEAGLNGWKLGQEVGAGFSGDGFFLLPGFRRSEVFFSLYLCGGSSSGDGCRCFSLRGFPGRANNFRRQK